MLAGVGLLLFFNVGAGSARAAPFTLAGSEWSIPIPAITDKSGPDGVETFVHFSANGRVSGSGGCNRFSGTYDQSGGGVKIGPLATTRKLCRKPIMEFEHGLLAALQRSHTVSGGRLLITLHSRDGDALFTLKRRDWD